jgi:hypothetical protein
MQDEDIALLISYLQSAGVLFRYFLLLNSAVGCGLEDGDSFAFLVGLVLFVLRLLFYFV